ncbi:MAG: NUDIX domain-containing protein [Actinomycetota bacterium]|nr:NUDIX domain-containing protein [Actinomycetota bacterium]
MYRDSSGKALTDYPQPSVAVDTAVLTVPEDDSQLAVLLVRRDGDDGEGEWGLPGGFLHERQRLAAAVARSLRDKVGLEPEVAPRQLEVFDDPERDSRGWVLSVAHVLVAPWRSVQPVVHARPDTVVVRPVGEARGLAFDHDRIVELAVERLRVDYRRGPGPECLVDEPFTLRRLRLVHEAVLGERIHPDNFRRLMVPQLHDTKKTTVGGVGRPAALFTRKRPGPTD